MASTSRWVRYALSGSTSYVTAQIGTRGLQRGTANTADKFTVPGSANNQLKINVDGAGAPAPYQITLTSGTDLDPRFVARDIQRKVQAYSAINNGFGFCQVEFSNYNSSNGYGQFIVYSGSTGVSSSSRVSPRVSLSVQVSATTHCSLMSMGQLSHHGH